MELKTLRPVRKCPIHKSEEFTKKLDRDYVYFLCNNVCS